MEKVNCNNNDSFTSIESEIKKVQQTVYNEGFLKKLLSSKSIEEAKQLFIYNNLEIDEDNLRSIGKYLNQSIKCMTANGHLDDEDLSSISGGVPVAVRYVGKVISFPFTLIGYSAGAIVAGFPKGVHDGFKETWYGS